MKNVTAYLSLIGVVLASFFSFEHCSYAQDFYTGKTIRILVGFPAGGVLTPSPVRSPYQ